MLSFVSQQRTIIIVASTMLISANAWSADKGFNNYDGDTIKATFRIANIDAPEIKGACETERQMAVRAKNFTAEWLAKGRVTIQQTGVDRYGRVLALISRNNEDLGKALIAAGLAKEWRGRRENWC
jgi:micrococcal nuclease